MITEKQSKTIKIKLIEQDKTQKQLAEEMGISRQYLSAIISGVMNNKIIEDKLAEMFFKKKKQ